MRDVSRSMVHDHEHFSFGEVVGFEALDERSYCVGIVRDGGVAKW